RPAQCPARGGGRIQALRQARARIVLALSSAAAYGGVVAYAVTRSSDAAPAVAGVGAVGALVLLYLLARGAADAVGWPLGILGLAYAIALVARGGSGVDEGAPLVAVGLLLCGEL